jgi:hypothetical protein
LLKLTDDSAQGFLLEHSRLNVVGKLTDQQLHSQPTRKYIFLYNNSKSVSTSTIQLKQFYDYEASSLSITFDVCLLISTQHGQVIAFEPPYE